MSNEYYKVLYNLWDYHTDKKSYSPNSFKNVLSQENPLFQGIAANDSKDLINFLIEKFHKELNKTNNKDKTKITVTQKDQLNEIDMLNVFFKEFQDNNNSIISNLFYGVLETKSQCQGCGNIKYNFQIYSFIEFPLQQVNNYCAGKGKINQASKGNKNPDVDLIDCFQYHCNVDLMTGDNRMYCQICQKLCDAYYGNEIYSLPHYLIINLNRGKDAVYKCNVNFPEKLNLLNFVKYKDGNTFLKLYAVISHIGPSSMSGHFVAYCKNHKDKKWYKYNDSIVTPCERKEEFRDGMPYILFYKAI
jgi:ubiquitin C-terminal hydrolase